MDLFDYDYRKEELRIRSVQRKMLRAETEAVAEQNAFASHPVIRYVRSLAHEDPLYPAIGYLRFAGQEDLEVPRKKSGKKVRKHRNMLCFPSVDYYEHVSDWDRVPTDFIHWGMPAHHYERPEIKGCGIIRTGNGEMLYSACPSDHDHHLKAKRKHCWSLRCPECVNDTALRKGIAIETKLRCYEALVRKSGEEPGPPSHWTVSPPQEVMKRAMQRSSTFDEITQRVNDSLSAVGAKAGYTVFHPWRQTETEWKLSPHFHVILYGYLDTDTFRKMNPGWIIKKIHPREQMRSIRHTFAYLMTHMGLGFTEVDPDEVDFDSRFLDYMIPGIRSPGAGYSEQDLIDKGEDKGKMVGDISGIDWIEFTMKALMKETRMRRWGGVSSTSLTKVGNHREYRIRKCRECGDFLRTYQGTSDSEGSLIRYITDSPVLVFSKDKERALTDFLNWKSKAGGAADWYDFARASDYAVCPLELGIGVNNDYTADGPFDQPDSYYLKRQRSAFGPMEEADA